MVMNFAIPSLAMVETLSQQSGLLHGAIGRVAPDVGPTARQSGPVTPEEIAAARESWEADTEEPQ
jgi:hypothetical protein